MYGRLKTLLLPKLIPADVKVLVAVSGGPDSVALAHILWRYMQEHPRRGNSLVITHVHHGVRIESDTEEEMVRSLARDWGVPCLVHRFQAKEYAQTTGESFQTAAREWRYLRWGEDMVRESCDLLATAHHLGDQAETVLYRILRGSGTAGLAGMYPVKNRMIRPLLDVTKAEILAYCHTEKLPYALDSSNAQPLYVRNRIRLELLPELEKNYNPQLQQALGRMSALMRRDEEYLQEQTERAWEKYICANENERVGLKMEIWHESPAILSRLIRKAAAQITLEPRGIAFQFVENILTYGCVPGWSQDMHGLRVSVDEEGIWFSKPILRNKTLADRSVHTWEIELKLNTWRFIPQLCIEAGLFEDGLNTYQDMVGEHSSPKEEVWSTALNLDDILQNRLVCRVRQAGDKMFVQGIGHKELKKVFQEAGIKAEDRDRLPLLAAGREVIWIPGIKRSDLFCPVLTNKNVSCVFRKAHG